MADKDESTDDSDLDEDEGKAKGGGNMLVLIILVLNLLLTGGVAAIVLLKPDPVPAAPIAVDAKKVAEVAADVEDGGPAKKIDDTVRGPMVEISNVTVQLRNPEFDRYVRMNFQIEVNEEDDAETVKGAVPVIRDKFIAYLSDRSYEELRGSGGLSRTKSVLFQRLTSVVDKETIRGLYVTNFVVQ